MTRLALIMAGLGVLSACNPQPINTEPPGFDSFRYAEAANYFCTFWDPAQPPASEARADYNLVFATHFDHPRNEAVARYGNETLRLIPQSEPVFGDAPVQIDYLVNEYSRFEVRLDLQPAGIEGERVLYTGTISMLGTEASRDITGSCGV